MSENTRIYILRLCYDDSDSMTDYYSPRAWFFSWFVAKFEGKLVTESKLRRALKSCPAWIQKLKWEYKKTWWKKPFIQSGSMKDDKDDQGIFSRNGKLTQSHYEKAYFFCLEETIDNSLFKSNNPDARQPIPQTFEELYDFVRNKEQERLNHWAKVKEKQKAIMPKVIRESHAVIDGQGFRVLTDLDKEAMIRAFEKKTEIEEAEKQNRCSECGIRLTKENHAFGNYCLNCASKPIEIKTDKEEEANQKNVSDEALFLALTDEGRRIKKEADQIEKRINKPFYIV